MTLAVYRVGRSKGTCSGPLSAWGVSGTPRQAGASSQFPAPALERAAGEVGSRNLRLGRYDVVSRGVPTAAGPGYWGRAHGRPRRRALTPARRPHRR